MFGDCVDKHSTIRTLACAQDLNEFKESALVFKIGNVTNAFMLRIYLGRGNVLQNRAELTVKVKPAPPGNRDTPHEKFMEVRICNFGVVKTDLGSFNLPRAGAVIQMPKFWQRSHSELDVDGDSKQWQ